MKQRLLLMILAAFVQVMSYAAIVLDEPVIGNDYMKFSGQCAEHNWKFVLDTYEWADKGPQFQLTITPMDVAQDAYFTSDDLADENYWEPLFRKYTKQLAKEEMEACENIKKIFITDVRLSEGQFRGYATDALNVLEINATGDYTIPAYCFGTSSTSTTTNSLKLKQFYCNVNGTLTIGTDVFPTNSGSMTIYTTKETLAQQWYDYKTSNGHGYTVYLNGTQYNGNGSSGGTSSTDVITNMKLTISYNGEQFTQSFDASGFQMLDLTAEFTNSMIIKKVEVQTQGTVSDVVFVATMNPADETPNSDNWVNMPLQWNKDGEGWVLDFGDGIELTKEIEDSQPRIFQFYVQAKNSAGSDIFYNNGGETYKVKFTYQGGENENWKVKFYKDGTAGLGLLVNGEQWSTMYNGSVIRETGYGWNPGEVSSFILEAFYLTFIVNDNVNVEDVSIQYRVYEEGSTPSQWNGISGTLQTAKDVWNSDKNRYDHKRSYIGENLARNVLNGLILGKNYVLDVMYQVKTTDGGYVMFGKEAEGTSFHFTPVEGGGSSQQQDDAVSAMTVTLTEDGVEATDYDVSGGSLVTEKGCKSLKLNNFKVTTTNEVQCVRLFYVVYPDGWSDGGPTAYDTDPNVWFKTIDATRREGSTWLENCDIDLLQDRCEGYPIQSNKNYRFYCYIGILVKGEWRYPDGYELRLDINTGNLDAILGDVNGDGSITMADANMVVNYFLATDPSSIANFNVAAADVNGDNAITMADANQIVNMFLGQ